MAGTGLWQNRTTDAADAPLPPAAGYLSKIADPDVMQASAQRGFPEKSNGVTLLAPVATGEQARIPLAPTVPVGYTEALNQSLIANPDLVALRGQLSVNQAMVGVAGTYPWNPFVQAEYFPNGSPFVPSNGVPGGGAGLSNYYVWAMQRFELARQGRFRLASARAAMTQVHWNIFQGELLNVAQTTRLYFAAVYQKDVHELARETAGLNDRLVKIVEQRFKANLAKASDVTTARVAARQAHRQLELADASLQAALLALQQQANLQNVMVPRETLSDVRWPDLLAVGDDLRCKAAELAEGRPDVLAAGAGVRVMEANFRLARAAMIPDVQAGPIYQTADDGTKFLGFRLQMDIPVWNNGGPLARQRRAEMQQQALTHEQLKVRAALEAETAIHQYERLRQLAGKFPGAAGTMPAELKQIIAQFQAGQADVLAVIATQNNLLQEKRLHLDLLGQLAQAAAAVVQSTGLPPDRVLQLRGMPSTNAGPAPVNPDLQPRQPR